MQAMGEGANVHLRTAHARFGLHVRVHESLAGKYLSPCLIYQRALHFRDAKPREIPRAIPLRDTILRSESGLCHTLVGNAKGTRKGV